MRIVAFSDFRVQDIRKTAEFAARMNPDVILYAGDDVGRFGPLDGNIMARLLTCNGGKQGGIGACWSFIRDSWRVTFDGEVSRWRSRSILPDTYYFNLSDGAPVTKADVVDGLSKMLRKDADDSQELGAHQMSRFAERQNAPIKSLLNGASIHFRQTRNGVEGIISLRTEDHIRTLASASRYGFGAILGNDDDLIYKTLLNRDSVSDIHDRPITVNGFTIIGQEGSSLSDGKGIGHLVYSENEIESHLDSSLSSRDGSRVILVSHTPPHRVLDRAQRFGKEHIGSPAVRRFIDRHKPLLVFCGHVHSHGGCETKIGRTRVINLASHDSRGSPGRICVVDVTDDLKVSTAWFLILPDRVLDYSPRLLNEGEALNSALRIHGVGYQTAQKLELNGIRTVEDVGAAGVERLVGCGIGMTTAQKMVRKAESLLNRTAMQMSPMLIPKEPIMFVDIETDLAQSYIWLISVLVEGMESSFRQFYAKTPASEGKILRSFLSYCKRFNKCVICYYSGSGFDERVIKSQITAHGLDGSVLGSWFDLCQAIRQHVAIPTSSFSLKEVADYFGYAYRHPGMDGFGAALEYTTSIGSRDEFTTKRLLEYGGDDVMSLHHIISKMNTVAGIAPDRSWQPPKDTLPVSYEEECTLLESLKEKGLSLAEIAGRFGKSEYYVRARLQESPWMVKGQNVVFDATYARDMGVSLYGKRQYRRKSPSYRKDRAIRGKVKEQISKNIFRVKAHGTIFQVGRKFLNWDP